MSDSMLLEGKEYISSKRASELSSYAQDYIGQLARKGIIDARRVGGLWYISMNSLGEYKSHADSYVPQQPERKEPIEVDSLVAFDGKDHVSAARAAQITGYHPDYVGQLARSGAIISRQVGNRWYIDREGILAHKREKDSLLGAVQAQSVGITRHGATLSESAYEDDYDASGPFLTYTRDDGDLLPVLERSEPVPEVRNTQTDDFSDRVSGQAHVVPIRTMRKHVTQLSPVHKKSEARISKNVRTPGKTIYYKTFRNLAAAALTIVIVLSFGSVTLKNSSVYGTNPQGGGSVIQRGGLTASAADALQWVRGFLENLLVKEIVYKRGQ